MLEDVLKSYREAAEVINWKSYNKNDLFFEYIKHEHDSLANNYYAGIVCRFWGFGARVYKQCNQHVPYEQCYDVLIDTINYVLKKRVWENKDSSLYGDPVAPDKAFHIALKRQRSLLLARLTAEKRQSNFNTLSIDEIHEDYNDAAEGLFDISDESMDKTLDEIHMINLIKNRPVISIIALDNICFNNWRNMKSVARNMKNLTKSSYEYYNKLYGVNKNDFIKALIDIKKCDYNTLLLKINGTLETVRREIYD